MRRHTIVIGYATNWFTFDVGDRKTLREIVEWHRDDMGIPKGLPVYARRENCGCVLNENFVPLPRESGSRYMVSLQYEFGDH